ncbi:MAG: SufS family cysteine desulfurase, partial [Pseudomonadota bacterium]
TQQVTQYPIERIRNDFPILNQTINNLPLAFLDSAASAQKPAIVIDRIKKCYEEEYANIHRGTYQLSMQTTAAFENARTICQNFINASSEKEIIFVRGVTEAINLVATSYGKAFLKKDDEVIISSLEHHANIVPWQMLRDMIGIKLKIIPIDQEGNIIIDEYRKLFTDKTKFVSVIHISNALGSLVPVKQLIDIAHQHDCHILIDGAQSVGHIDVDVKELDADFYVFSSHKIYGPSGIGVLYGKEAILEKMPPYHGGGEMIKTVTFDKTEYAALPAKFEAGTPAIAQAIGMASAIEYIQSIGVDAIHNYEAELMQYAYDKLSDVEDIIIYGAKKPKTSIVTFNLKNLHPQDVNFILDKEAVAVRTGHHCAQPIMQHLAVNATIRASFGLYTNFSDIDSLTNSLNKARRLLS